MIESDAAGPGPRVPDSDAYPDDWPTPTAWEAWQMEDGKRSAAVWAALENLSDAVERKFLHELGFPDMDDGAKRTMAVAKALFAQRHPGVDPAQPVLMGPGVMIGEARCIRYPIVPAWAAYFKEASEAILVVDLNR